MPEAQPHVTAVMLLADRPDMARRAIDAFMLQAYPQDSRTLIIWDTGKNKYAPPFVYDQLGVEIWHRTAGASVGLLRNYANAKARPGVIMHWDSDDWFHPERMAEQVALLQASGADAVGYSDCLFWDCREPGTETFAANDLSWPGQAWLYTAGKRNYAVGTSLCYWRRTWEQRRFPDVALGEDTQWQHVVKPHVVTSCEAGRHPRIVATIHGGNTSMNSYSTLLKGVSEQFRRVPEWDDYCRKLFSAGHNPDDKLSGDPTREAGADPVNAISGDAECPKNE